MTKRFSGWRTPLAAIVAIAVIAAGGWAIARFGADEQGVATYLPHLRRGASKRPGTLTVIGLGDSVTAGTNCDCEGFVGDYSARLADKSRMTVKARNLGIGGASSAALAGALLNDRTLRSRVRNATVALITIGANDFDFSSYAAGGCEDLSCFEPGLAAFRANLTRIVATVSSLRRGRPIAILVTGYWAVWLDGDVGRAQGETYMRVNIALTKKVNAIAEAVAGSTRARYVDIYTPFRGVHDDRDDTNLLSDDGDHPNAAGHAVIADALIKAGLARVP
ncbi:MAG: hypothetical protein NVSMB57_14070 [Actinomycetota bacterium]